ncbi:MAG: aldehyde dehydrogenase family protein [Anaerolineae bacterium]|nr:aldehyde dehydrogenase family protein [Anaerolineae bacterium]
MPQKFLVAGEWRSSNEVLDVTFPYDGTVSDSIYLATAQDMEDAIVAAQRGFEITRRLPSYQRSEILQNLHHLMKQHFDEIVELMIMESGKTRKVSIAELTRAVQTIFVSSEEARRLEGDVFSVDWTPAGKNRQGFTKRVPIGTVLAIAPFNYPINLACHKIGPAIAVGNSLILKPAEKTPLSSVKMAELILEAGFPPQAFSMIQAKGTDTEKMVTDPRIAMISFTGSSSVGWQIKAKAGHKKVLLELGGNAGLIIHNDANLDLAIPQAVDGGFANAGQNCISVQRMIVQQDIYEEYTDRYLAGVKKLKVGDPRDADTDIGPMISLRDAERAESWITEAKAQGATILHGGKRDGALLEPTVLSKTTPDMKVFCEEIFAPVVTLSPYRDWEQAVATINDSQYGLQAGLFTQDIKRIMDAWDRIDVGGLMVNGVSTFRVDHMPYGGVKNSGIGREGVKYTIEEMTELKLMVINLA